MFSHLFLGRGGKRNLGIGVDLLGLILDGFSGEGKGKKWGLLIGKLEVEKEELNSVWRGLLNFWKLRGGYWEKGLRVIPRVQLFEGQRFGCFLYLFFKRALFFGNMVFKGKFPGDPERSLPS